MSLLIIIACLLVISLTLNVYLLLRVRYQDNINQMYSEKIDRLWRFIEYRSIKAQGDRCSKFIMFFASYLENYNDEAYINCLNFKHSLCDIINSKVANISMLRDVYKCQYINEQKIQNKNVQKCKLCNLRRFIFYFFYFIFYSIGSACNINNMRMMQ